MIRHSATVSNPSASAPGTCHSPRVRHFVHRAAERIGLTSPVLRENPQGSAAVSLRLDRNPGKANQWLPMVACGGTVKSFPRPVVVGLHLYESLCLPELGLVVAGIMF